MTAADAPSPVTSDADEIRIAIGPVDPFEAAALHGAAFAEPQFGAAWSAAAFDSAFAAAETIVVAAFDEDFVARPRPIGLALGRRIGDDAELLTICRSPHRAGDRIGDRLLRAALLEMSRLDCASLFLEVSEANDHARALYQRFGFSLVGQRPGYYRDAANARVDALILSKPLIDVK